MFAPPYWMRSKTNMATAGAERSTVSLIFSDYCNSLEQSARARYKEKCKKCGFDPYAIKPSGFLTDLNGLPQVEYPDIVNYLVLQTSWLSKEQMKAYKSLEAYNFFVSGWVSNLLTKNAKDGRVVVYARVNHSQRSRETPLKTWILSDKNGDIQFGHCNCMAGLSEVCSHVGALLFAVEASVQFQKSITCTQEKCKWLPPHVKEVPYLPVCKVDFSSAHTKHGKLCEDKNEGTAPKISKKLGLTAPSSDEIEQFFAGLAQAKSKSVVLSIVPPFNNEFLPKNNKLPDALTTLYNEKYMELNYIELLEKCYDIHLSVTEAECKAMEKETRNQAASKVWFAQRAGRITSSKLKAACHTDISKPSKSLIKQICYPEAHKFFTAATSWGCKHEKRARNVYTNKMSESHEKFVVSDSGLYVNPKWPHLGASPDGLVECACCGQGTCEIKCPFCLRYKTAEDATKQRNSCLLELNDKLSLNRQHAYYYQVQAQMFISDDENEGCWCYCQKNIEGSMLIGCDSYDCKIMWFHMKCLKLDVAPKGKWYCPTCMKAR